MDLQYSNINLDDTTESSLQEALKNDYKVYQQMRTKISSLKKADQEFKIEETYESEDACDENMDIITSDIDEEFEDEERYNISATTNNPNNNLVFFKPTIGEIDKPFDPVNGHLGIDITTKPSTPIVSIYQGIVLYSAYTLDEDYFIQVIHPQGFISVYKGAANVFKKSGDIVQSGEVIAIMGEDSSKSLHFELWRDSQAQNPLNYIVFE